MIMVCIIVVPYIILRCMALRLTYIFSISKWLTTYTYPVTRILWIVTGRRSLIFEYLNTFHKSLMLTKLGFTYRTALATHKISIIINMLTIIQAGTMFTGMEVSIIVKFPFSICILHGTEGSGCLICNTVIGRVCLCSRSCRSLYGKSISRFIKSLIAYFLNMGSKTNRRKLRTLIERVISNLSQ